MAHYKGVESHLAQISEKLMHSHRLATLGTMSSIIAHEYNNILTPIISYAQMALKNPDDTEFVLKALQRALSGAERAATISTSLLGFAADNDQTRVAHLPTVIEQAINCMGRHPEKDGINLAIDIPPIDLAISALDLEHVILNLMLNARQAMRGRGGCLTINASVLASVCHVEVIDTGPGIPAEIRDRVFEPFVTQRSDSTGTGLGLCMCRDRLNAAGGTIELLDRDDETGAAFLLTIPIADEVSNAA